jgi:hypothetical protein
MDSISATLRYFWCTVPPTGTEDYLFLFLTLTNDGLYRVLLHSQLNDLQSQIISVLQVNIRVSRNSPPPP